MVHSVLDNIAKQAYKNKATYLGYQPGDWAVVSVRAKPIDFACFFFYYQRKHLNYSDDVFFLLFTLLSAKKQMSQMSSKVYCQQRWGNRTNLHLMQVALSEGRLQRLYSAISWNQRACRYEPNVDE